jgi:hypothetical protein
MITVTEMERMQLRKDVKTLLDILDRNGFDGFKKIVEIFKRDHSPQKEAPTIFPINEKISFRLIDGGLPNGRTTEATRLFHDRA